MRPGAEGDHDEHHQRREVGGEHEQRHEDERDHGGDPDRNHGAVEAVADPAERRGRHAIERPGDHGPLAVRLHAGDPHPDPGDEAQRYQDGQHPRAADRTPASSVIHGVVGVVERVGARVESERVVADRPEEVVPEDLVGEHDADQEGETRRRRSRRTSRATAPSCRT